MKMNFSFMNSRGGLYPIVALTALSLFVPSSASATNVQGSQEVQQNDKVTGVVKDANGEPMVGVTIRVSGTGKGTVTDADGRYTLDAKRGATLEFSSIGFKTQKIRVGQGPLSVVMQEDNNMLDEVVAIGYGAQHRKQDLSASVGVIDNADKLTVRPVTSTESMLQGQIPGVTIQSNGGDPTSTPSIVIRGQGSQNGDNVLWVVDGVPGATISSLNDIESIVVLKDAASAAIYGAQSGAGGVVLVTTKQAKKGRTQISYDGTYGIRNAYNLPHGLTAQQEIDMRKLSYANAGLSLPSGWDTTKNPWIATNRTDWIDEIFRTAFYHRHNVTLSSGNESSQHRLSFMMDNDQGTLINTYNNQMGLRYNGNFDINKWVSVSENFTWKNYKSRSVNTTSAYNGAIINAIYMPSSAEVYNHLDGTYGGTTTEDPAYIAKYGSNFADIHGDAINPVRLLKAPNDYNKTSDIWTTTTLSVHDVVPGLKFTSRFSYNLTNNTYKNFVPKRDEVGKPFLTNELTESSYRTDQWKTENTLTYDNSFGKHTVGLLLSTTADHYTSRSMQIDGKDFSDETAYLQYIGYAGTTTAADALSGPDSNVSVIARASYSFDDRYFLTASWRRDYAGRLPKDNNHGDFPAVTGAWKISNEKFFHKSNLISLLKLRASWGRVGNLGSIGYNYRSPLLNKETWNEQAWYGVATGKQYGTFLYYGTALNQKLTWETSQQTDIGLDVAMFNNRLSASLDYFEKRTYDLIQDQTMNWPSTIGLAAMKVNQGVVRNRGLEFSATWTDKLSANTSYWVGGNVAWLKNWVSDIGVKDDKGNPGVWTGDGSYRDIPYVYQTMQGQPLNSFYLIKYAGIFQSDAEAQAYKNSKGEMIQPNAKAGDLKFVDYNGDGKIDTNDRQYCGSATPKWTYALQGGFTWKELTVSAMLQGVGKAQAFNASKYSLLSDADGSFNRSQDILKAWSTTNTSSNIPIISKADNNGNFSTPSTWYLESASYLRLKNLTIAYDLTSLLRKSGHFRERGSNLSVALCGENLFTITPYSGIDPECGGYDALKYPVSRTFSLSVKLTY